MQGLFLSKKNEKNFELSFLWEVSKVLSDNFDPEDIVLNLNTVFNRFFKTTDLKIYLYDSASNSLRDFLKTWFIISNKHHDPHYMKIFMQLASLSENRFVVNEKIFILDEDFSCLSEIKFNNNQNSVFLPIVQKWESIGMM